MIAALAATALILFLQLNLPVTPQQSQSTPNDAVNSTIAVSAVLLVLTSSLVAYVLRKVMLHYWLPTRSWNHPGASRQTPIQPHTNDDHLAQLTLECIADGIITTDANGMIRSLNLSAQRLTGWTAQEAIGLPLHHVFNTIDEEMREPIITWVEGAIAAGTSALPFPEHTLLITQDGDEIAVDGSIAPLCTTIDEIVGAVLTFRDVTHVRNLTRQLSRQAAYDSLTGLVNRHEFENRLQRAIETTQTHHHEHTLCFLDLDRFKVVNDTCGHVAGDELLRQIGALLQNTVRKSDTVARLGGDEFSVLLYQCPLEQAMYLAQTVCTTIENFRFAWEDKTFSVGVSIGLVSITVESPSLSNILNAADAACYTAKRNGRGQVHLYQADDEEVSRNRGEMQWIGRVNRALEENRFCLYYQPIAALYPHFSTKPHGEVLLRLIDEQGEVVSPGHFIPAAERYNLMPVFDRWVIRTLFAHLSNSVQPSYRSLSHPGVFGINLSAGSVNDDSFLPFLLNLMEQHHISPDCICFEVSETVAIASLSRTIPLLQNLKALGYRTALDDFGNGISSLSYLKNLPVDYLKIAGELIKDVATDSTSLAIVEAISRVSRGMGIKTIAEYVTNETIRQQILDLGIDYAQGYSIAHPKPLEQPTLVTVGAV